MTTFRASIAVDEDTLTTSRPLTAPEAVADLFASVEYGVTDADRRGGIVSVEVVVETSGESETPIGDSLSTTTSTPLPSAADDDDEVQA
jgi:hypothetical protein